MKVIIIAGGLGTRLGKYTENLPKCMLEFDGKPLIQRQVDIFRKCGIKDIIIIRKHLADKIQIKGVKYINEPLDVDGGIVTGLFIARKEFDGLDDILVTYGDTIHASRVIKQIMQERFALSKAIDIDYKEYWIARNGDWSIDSESCTLNPDGSIKEIGEEGITSPERLHGRDASLTFISKEFAPKVLEHYKELEENYWDIPLIDNKPIRKFNMTNLLQSWINNGWIVMANKIKRGWMEFDTAEDYELACEWLKQGTLKRFIRLEDN